MQQHPVRRVARAQGRSLRWIAQQAGISANYLHRILLPADDPDHRAAPDWLYPRLSQILGVSEETLKPPSGDLSTGEAAA